MKTQASAERDVLNLPFKNKNQECPDGGRPGMIFWDEGAR